jgi:mRNA interferase MazF
MPSFERGDVVKLPYRYTNRPVTEHRPGLVIAVVDEGPGLLWVMMITSAANRPRPSDVSIVDAQAVGSPAPSVVRTAEIATVDVVPAGRLGGLAEAEPHQVADAPRRHLANAGDDRD